MVPFFYLPGWLVNMAGWLMGMGSATAGDLRWIRD